MRYVAAYMLAVLGGNTSPSAADVKKILSSVGIDADETCVKKVIGELKGKNVEDVMAAGREKLSSMPSGGGGGGGGAPAASGSSSAAPVAAKEVVEEKKKEESESDEDEDMGFGLFD